MVFLRSLVEPSQQKAPLFNVPSVCSKELHPLVEEVPVLCSVAYNSWKVVVNTGAAE